MKKYPFPSNVHLDHFLKSEAIDWVAREEERPGVVAEQLEQVEIFYRKSIHTLYFTLAKQTYVPPKSEHVGGNCFSA